MPSDSTFTEVKNAFQSIAGLESLTAADEFFLTSSLNRAVYRAYNESDSWPRYLVVGQERSLIQDQVVPYSSEDILISGAGSTEVNGVYVKVGTESGANRYEYIALNGDVYSLFILSGGSWRIRKGNKDYYKADNNNLVTPPSTGWYKTSSGDDPIPSVINQLLLGEFLRIHRTLPFLNNSALEFEFYVDSIGAHILNARTSNSNSVFVTYKKELQANFTPDSTDIPGEFVDYIIYTALSDFYTGDGQTDKAAMAATQAKMMLDIELLRLDKKANNNTINKKFSTYVNRQAR